MFTIEIRVNGAMIGHIYGRNISHGDGGDFDDYSYEYYEPYARKLMRGKVTHKRGDGIRRLTSVILADIDKPTRKDKK